VAVSGALRKGIVPERAHYFRFSRRERENRGLGGGEGRNRTHETLRQSMGSIRPKSGGLFGPKKSITPAESMFASDSAPLLVSPVPFFLWSHPRKFFDA
jgi:hypothetical protein